MTSPSLIIEQTKKWIIDVVIGCNFCPFAAKEIKQNTVHYEVILTETLDDCLQHFFKECERLDREDSIETSLLIYPNAVQRFDEYLNLLELAERLLKEQGYEGIYQVASFHPEYCFAGVPADDAANYTNRSPYPMLHLLREDSVEQALKKYKEPEQIPERNIRFAREKGELYMKMLRDAAIGLSNN